MYEQAAGFGALAAISPSALFVMAVFLASANPRRTSFAYVAGALVMTVAMAVGVLFIIRAAGLNLSTERSPRYDLRLALGILSLAGAFVMARRKPRAPDPEKQAQRFISRLTSRPGPVTGFVAGLILFVPSAMFLAAVQVVATARAAVVATVVALLIVVVLTVLVVWLPLLTYLVAPDATTGALQRADEWLRAHGRMIVVCALAAAGGVLVVNAILGLT
jgi:riboflavin transporter FmnP